MAAFVAGAHAADLVVTGPAAHEGHGHKHRHSGAGTAALATPATAAGTYAAMVMGSFRPTPATTCAREPCATLPITASAEVGIAPSGVGYVAGESTDGAGAAPPPPTWLTTGVGYADSAGEVPVAPVVPTEDAGDVEALWPPRPAPPRPRRGAQSGDAACCGPATWTGNAEAGRCSGIGAAAARAPRPCTASAGDTVVAAAVVVAGAAGGAGEGLVAPTLAAVHATHRHRHRHTVQHAREARGLRWGPRHAG